MNQFLNYYIKHVADENTGNHQPGGIELMYQQFLRTKNERNAKQLHVLRRIDNLNLVVNGIFDQQPPILSFFLRVQ